MAAARVFVHSLNILVKYVRLYGFDHKRTNSQFRIAWQELQSSLPTNGKSGFLLGVSGDKLLLDGIPLESGQAEQSFARLLSAAGLASLHFSSGVKVNDFSRLVRAFATGGSKAEAVAEQIKAALGDESESTIKVNEVRFVAHDPAAGEIPLAAQIAAQNLGPEFKEWLSDPQKLIQLITAAEGAKGPEGVGAGQSGQAFAPAIAPLQEHEVVQGIRLLTKFGELSQEGQDGKSETSGAADPQLKAALRDMLDKAAAQTPGGTAPDSVLLMKAAEHLAIRFALERFQRGDVRVNAVHEMLERMSKQMEALRKVLRVHEEKMSRAGMLVESHADILDRQFWAEVPESGKRSVLMSPDAPCVPARNVRSYVEDLMQRPDQETAIQVLRNYCECVASRDLESRCKTATGLSQLADVYNAVGGDVLAYAIRRVSDQLREENELEAQSLLSAAFVRLSQEASTRRNFTAVRQVLSSMQEVEQKRPVLAQDLRPRVGVENRLAEFIEEALRLPQIPADLLEVLRHAPSSAAEQIAERFSRCNHRQECDRMVELIEQVGEQASTHLRQLLRMGPVRQAAASVGILSRINHSAVLELLPARMREWNRLYHDIIVRQISLSNAPQRGQILMELLDVLEPLVLPQALDEIGFSGDRSLAPALIVLAGEGTTESRSPFIRLKAIEALGRLRDHSALPLLCNLIEAKKMWKWIHPRELRVAAAQALLKIEPSCGPDLLKECGFTADDLELLPLDAQESSWARQRRYERIVPERTVAGVASSSWGRSDLVIRQLSMGGGLADKDDSLRLGSEASLDLQLGLRHVRSQVMLRRARQGEISFEIVDMELDERSKLRRLLSDQLHRMVPAIPAILN